MSTDSYSKSSRVTFPSSHATSWKHRKRQVLQKTFHRLQRHDRFDESFTFSKKTKSKPKIKRQHLEQVERLHNRRSEAYHFFSHRLRLKALNYSSSVFFEFEVWSRQTRFQHRCGHQSRPAAFCESLGKPLSCDSEAPEFVYRSQQTPIKTYVFFYLLFDIPHIGFVNIFRRNGASKSFE